MTTYEPVSFIVCEQVRVLKDIAAGEEVFQSYIDINLGKLTGVQ